MECTARIRNIFVFGLFFEKKRPAKETGTKNEPKVNSGSFFDVDLLTRWGWENIEYPYVKINR